MYTTRNGTFSNLGTLPSTKFSISNVVPGDGNVYLSWNEVPGATGYLINYGRNFRTSARVVKSAAASFTVKGLENGATYHFTVLTVPEAGPTQKTPQITITLPERSGIQARQLGLLINDNDPDSVVLGEYYRTRRNIPSENIVHLNISKVPEISRAAFQLLKTQVDLMLPETVQAVAIAWTIPSRVECNSITSALALGFMDAPCIKNTCSWATSSPYYGSNSTHPFTDFKMRPAMMLAALSLEQAKQLVDRGIASDGTQPHGSAYIMNTTDATRSLRARIFPASNLGKYLSPYVDVQIKNADWISGTTDALFYFQGLQAVNHIGMNTYPPGAVADHLTSYGGMLTDSYQMSALHFIAGGATGTFGTVSEPCAYSQKFPDPSIMISRYTKGETLIEAYWKSVLQTFQGAFVGEPLANPWKQIISRH
ncbi:unnamed protein product [Rotaria socialis]|uniref:Fibronectin type-III domain-containing protein n=1 Tax=Rotaria socialis TaxID=392032 RepID=A0A817ZB31_9BILA|nr:unnamed protein product [Rotaria socialis]